MSYFQKFLRAEATRIARVGSENVFWLFPAALGAGWLLWPAIDLEWKMEMGLAEDPEAPIIAVQEAKTRRMETLKLYATNKQIVAMSPKSDDDEDDEDEDEEGDGDEEEEEEEEGIVIKPLYHPAKGKKLNRFEMWDNFSIKSLKMNDEDDDDEDEDDDDDDDDDE